MRQTRIAVIFALLITTLLAVGGVSTAAPGEGYTSFASRIARLATRISPSPTARAAAPLRAEGGRLTLRGSGGPASNLRLSAEGVSSPTVYEAGTGLEALAGETRAHALASADFDEDGTPDIVGGYEAASGAGILTLQRGNPDAVYPNSPGARERRERGQFSGAPFHESAAAFLVPEAAQFVGAGDFDADGHADVVAGRRGGGALYLLRGDGRGNLAGPERVDLPGSLTAFAAGEMNRRDGLEDIVVGVVGEAGASALVFESPAGALRGRPETIPLPAEAGALALGALDADSPLDLAVAAGRELIIIHGRDRRLSADEGLRAGVPAAEVSRSEFEYALAGLATGDFAGDEREDVAVLSAEGSVQVLTRAAAGKETAGAFAWQRSERASVGAAEYAPGLLVTAKVSGLAKDDLLLVGGGRVGVITNEAAKAEAGRDGTAPLKAKTELRASASLAGEGGLAAVLPMRLSPSALSDLVTLGGESKAPSVSTQAAAAVFTVNTSASTPDANPGDGQCKDSAGNCSLPAAVNEIASSSDPGPFTVNFNIPGAGVPVINTTDLSFNKPVIIDGATQPAGRVEVRGSGRSLFIIRGGASTLRGLVLSGAENAILIQTAGNNVVEGNYLGTNAEGTAAAAARNSLNVYVQSSNNRIGGTSPAARNVISGANIGIDITAATGNVIQGNYIGADASGAAAVGNRYGIYTRWSDAVIGGTAPGAGNLISGNGDGGGNAVYLNTDSASAASAVQGNRIGTNAAGDAAVPNVGVALWLSLPGGTTTVGGTTPAARNVISGNNGRGLYITSTSAQPAYVQGNYIGTSADGTTALPNLGGGVHLDRAGINLGGAVAGAGNLISGNGGDGVYVGGAFGSPNHRIQGNLIGTDVSGTLALPNQGDGVEAFRADNMLVGGATAEARNVISGNGENGLNLSGTDGRAASPLRVEGNYIGVNRFGTGPLGNGRSGVLTTGTAESNNVGGTAPGAGNLIAHNSESGVASDRPWVTGPVLSNSIHSNGELGIDVNDDGVSPINIESNSNRPELLTAANTAEGTVVTGRVYNYGSLQPYTIQFFSNTACDPSGFGEGRTPVGQVSVPAPTRYTYINFSATLSPAVAGGATITAVNVRAANQSDPDPNLLYTSEFSNCLQLAAPTPTPTPTPGASPTPTPSATPTPTPTPLQLFAIAPARGGDAAPVMRQLTGQGFLPGTTVRLTRAGQPDVVGAAASVTNEGTTLTATFDLAGRARGLWSVVVTNPDGATATLADAFNVEAARPANVWVDVVGRFRMRFGRTQKFHIAYGNTGDVDSEPAMLRLTIPEGLSVAGLPRLADGDAPLLFPQGDATVMEFYVPGIAAGSSTYLPVDLQTEGELAHTDVQLSVAAFVSPGLREAMEGRVAMTVTPEVVEQTGDFVKTVHHVSAGGESFDIVDEVTTAQDTQAREPSFEWVDAGDEIHYRYTVSVANDAGSPAKSGALRPPAAGATRAQGLEGEFTKTTKVVKVRKLDEKKIGDLDAQVFVWKANREQLLKCLREKGALPPPDPIRGDRLMREADGYTVLVFTQFSRDGRVVDTKPNYEYYKLYGRTGNFDRDLILEVEAKALRLGAEAPDLYKEPWRLNRDIEEKILYLILRKCMCKEDRPPVGQAPSAAARPALEAESCPVCPGGGCDNPEKKRDLNIVFAFDPNDKNGPQGAGAPRFINGATPSSYAVFFENKPEATAPAQDVVVTDQLDVTKFDLSTFQLGPVAFGKDRVVAPPPGLSQWTTDVDLRPANNLIVRVNAGLNFQTGVARWAFTSLDPATMQPTDDPLAGFLPPNRSAPEGEGSVLFSVSTKAGLQTGAEVRNSARIVFDVNAPIDTPVWLNTIDNSSPTSKVSALAATQPYVVFYVNWAGADTGSGLRDYTVFVSEDGGAYTAWLTETTETSGIFAGEPGKTYSFYSVARDRAGNVEAVKTSPEATATTPNVVTNVVDDPRFFVLQHYRDFLGRDPDPYGFDFWTDEIAKCGGDAACREVKRVNVSAAFFLSIEFQETGYLAYRARKAAFGNLQGKPIPITRAEMLLDAQSLGAGVVVGAENWRQRLEQNKQAYFDQLTASERFAALYPQTMTPEQYVDALNASAGAPLSQSERDALVAELKASTTTRAQALRAVAEDPDLVRSEFNRAFVLMQYFGYLRRNPDDAPDTNFDGYNFWLAKLDSFNGNFIQAEMVKAFLDSTEYRKRFGQ